MNLFRCKKRTLLLQKNFNKFTNKTLTIMEKMLEANGQEELCLSEKEIFRKIWMSPRKVFKFINDTNYNELTTVLLIFGGIASTLNNASSRNIGDYVPLWAVLIACVVGGGIFGWISIYIYAALLSWTGKWLKGVGNTKSLLRMMSCAIIPSLVIILLFILRIILYGNEVFQSNMDIYSKGAFTIMVYAFTAFVEVAIVIWTLVILVIGISEVQKLSVWKSILNMILPVLLLIAVYLMVSALAFIIRELLN